MLYSFVHIGYNKIIKNAYKFDTICYNSIKL